MTARSAGLLLAVATAGALALAAGLPGLVYPLIFAAAVAPGIPLGIMLFGRHQPAAWVIGALLGYGLTQLALWGVIVTGWASRPAFAIAWLLLLLLSCGISRTVRSEPVVPAPPWSPADIRAMLLVLLMVPLLMGVTYRNLGRTDAAGNRYYRAYFTADFVWHSALAYELGKFTLPPHNPYLSPQTMNYYWTYFLLPSVAARTAPAILPNGHDVQQHLKANAILAGLLMVAALFILVRSGSGSAPATAWAVILSALAASAEGTYTLIDLLTRGRPLAILLDTNIDAVTAWAFGGLRIDNMPRSLWYTPQHTTSLALGLAGLTIAVLTGAAARPAAIAGAGLALGLSTTINPLLGGVCSLIYGAAIVADGVTRPRGMVMIARHAGAALFVVAAVAWGAASKVTDGAGSALDIGFAGFSRRHPILTLLLSIGPVLIPALPGMLLPRSDSARRAVTVGAAGITLGILLLYFVRISEASWVGFRAGQILLVSIPILLARTIEFLPRSGRATLVAAVLLAGLPTTLIDTYNTQDISNHRMGPGFRWTLWTTSAQRLAFDWLRANTSDEDIVQMEPIVRAREHWTLIPSFAGRRMAAGQPISLLPLPEYQERSARVRTVFATVDPGEAGTIARALGIDYLYVDKDDAAAYPAGTRKFDEHPETFERVFVSRDVRIYKVR